MSEEKHTSYQRRKNAYIVAGIREIYRASAWSPALRYYTIPRSVFQPYSALPYKRRSCQNADYVMVTWHFMQTIITKEKERLGDEFDNIETK